MKYLTYVHTWIKRFGFDFKNQNLKTFSSNLDLGLVKDVEYFRNKQSKTNRKYVFRIRFLGPIQFYKELNERQIWLEAARAKVNKSTKINIQPTIN